MSQPQQQYAPVVQMTEEAADAIRLGLSTTGLAFVDGILFVLPEGTTPSGETTPPASGAQSEALVEASTPEPEPEEEKAPKKKAKKKAAKKKKAAPPPEPEEPAEEETPEEEPEPAEEEEEEEETSEPEADEPAEEADGDDPNADLLEMDLAGLRNAIREAAISSNRDRMLAGQKLVAKLTQS